MATLERIAEVLRSADCVTILCHQFPDGDTLGSGTALCRGLWKLGKRAVVRCSDPIGSKFAYLFRDLPDDEFEGGLVISVDVADASLLGQPLLSRYEGKIALAVDHHRSRSPFAAETYVDSTAAATCEIIYDLLGLLNVPIDPLIANSLYTGITTDTGCFKYVNTTPHTHRVAAKLMEAGADSVEIDRAMFDTKSRARIEMERRVLDSMRFSKDGRIAVIRITKQMIAETGAVEDDLDGIASIPRCIEGVRIGITLREKDDGTYKVSLRARPPADASVICEQFGGGGHKGAAGCTIALPLDEAEQKIFDAAERYLSENV
ncbi:MAG: Bifunctional oligoribonuclease and PAP phosphatase NrnA [Thermocaproicibacter melissae]|jgi:bifunctional oligoribonuclease and PAP phosphatase NrnA|uniref:DHH family phosphoesterase n=1 Tax=Thermocaproicibacter melissae TaxID=2966552 RepID=UPI0024B1D462|nr:bifunctional oligoribonuclease/PAP phosphatase NrnA [Thermocaproicibacter melissae]WBY64403.1 bifunctional oligoribonuclease/PAP phosphatase NrnA [Thermocaproicibacter melissae]